MTKNVLPGLLLAAAGALTIALGHLLGLDLDQVALLGVALGGVIGLVPDRGPLARIGGFLAGFVLAWVGYAVRAAVLPDTAVARGLVVFLVVLGCMLVAVATVSRLPLWSTLVGAAALVGAYESAYVASPPDFVAQSSAAATTVLLAAALGTLGASLLGPDIAKQREAEQTTGHRGTPVHTGPALNEEAAR
ncbi:MAG: hypothetical protein Q7T56_11075 [Nocardioidaceae bacterium]|nr:hypothetical protein [Nocardioidaceae bacterium]